MKIIEYLLLAVIIALVAAISIGLYRQAGGHNSSKPQTIETVSAVSTSDDPGFISASVALDPSIGTNVAKRGQFPELPKQ